MPNRKAVRLLASSIVKAGLPGANVPANPAGSTGEKSFRRHTDAARSSAKFARGAGSNEELGQSKNPDIQSLRAHLSVAAKAVDDSVSFILSAASRDPNAAFAGAVPFLRLMGITAGGWQMARAALIAEKKLKDASDKAFLEAKIKTARFFGDHVLSQAPGLAATVVSGSAAVMSLTDEQFLAA